MLYRVMCTDTMRCVIFEANQKPTPGVFLLCGTELWKKYLSRKSQEIIKFQEFFGQSAMLHIIQMPSSWHLEFDLHRTGRTVTPRLFLDASWIPPHYGVL